MRIPLITLQAVAVVSLALLSRVPTAAAQGTVVVYTVLPLPELNRRLSDEFTKQTGIKVEYLNVPAVGTLAARIRSEKDKPRADVFAAAPIDFHEALAKDGLLTSYKSPALPPDSVAKGYADPNGYWTGWFATTTAIFWNTNQFKKEFGDKVAVPSNWDDLLKSEFKGKLVSANPQTSAIGFIQLATQIFRLGEDKAWDYTRKFSTNVLQYTPSAPIVVTLVEKGEAPAGVFWLSDILTAKLNRAQPLDYTIPPDNAVAVWAASLVKGGPNPEAAKKFIDFLSSEYAQDTAAKIGFYHPLNPKVAPPAGSPSLAEMQVVKYDMEWATANMDRVRKKWAEVSGQ